MMSFKIIPGYSAFMARVKARQEAKANPPENITNETPEKKPLFLIMQKYWFDEILSGNKEVEFRDDTPFYRSRFITKDGKFKNYQTVIMQVGYHANARRMTIEVKKIILDGDFEIHFGKILDSNFDQKTGIVDLPNPLAPKKTPKINLRQKKSKRRKIAERKNYSLKDM